MSKLLTRYYLLHCCSTSLCERVFSTMPKLPTSDTQHMGFSMRPLRGTTIALQQDGSGTWFTNPGFICHIRVASHGMGLSKEDARIATGSNQQCLHSSHHNLFLCAFVAACSLSSCSYVFSTTPIVSLINATTCIATGGRISTTCSRLYTIIKCTAINAVTLWATFP